jgi:ribosomal protein L29
VREALKTQITAKDVALEELKGQVAALKESLFSATDSPQAELGGTPLALNAENDELHAQITVKDRALEELREQVEVLKQSLFASSEGSPQVALEGAPLALNAENETLQAQITVKDRALEELREQVEALKQSLFASTEDSPQVALEGAPLALNSGNSSELEATNRVIEELREQVAVLKQSLFDATTDTSEGTAATNPEVVELTARVAASDESVRELQRQVRSITNRSSNPRKSQR